MPFECRKLIATEIWQSKKYIHQLGPMHYIYPLLDMSVANHMLQSYIAFRSWLNMLGDKHRLESLTPEEILNLSVAIGGHDARKPAWTPVSEPYQKLSHELLEECEPFKNFCEDHSLNFELIFDTVKGKGRYGVFLEGEMLNFDQIGYLLLELKAAGAIHENEWRGVPINAYDIIKLLRYVTFMEEQGKFQVCIKYPYIENKDVQLLLLRYKEALVQSWRRFINPKILSLETLADYLLRRSMEKCEKIRDILNDPFATDFCLEEALMNSGDKGLEKVAHGIREGSIINNYRVLFGPLTPSFKKRLLESDFKGYRKLMSAVEEETRERIGGNKKALIAASASKRHKPYFNFTWKPEDWTYTIKYETMSGGLEDVGIRLAKIEKLRKMERYAYLHVVFPITAGSTKILKPLMSEDRRKRRKEWESFLQAALNRV
jgi:HD superfamily phosphohydrolase